MGILTRNAPATALAALVALATLSLIQDGAAGAPSKAKAAGTAETSAATKTSYESGIKAYQAGRYQNAADQLSTALRGGGLNSAAMARGLYYRGLAYKQLNKPGLAISDLTSALWLKNGLSDEERKAATAERAEAYKAAGLGDGNSGKDRVASSDPKSETAIPAQASPAPQSAAAASAAAEAAQNTSARTADTAGVPQPLTMGAETAVPPPPARQGGGSIDQSAALQQTAPATTPAQSAAAGQPNGGLANGGQAAAASQTSGFSGFFSNLFAGGSSASTAPAEASAGVTTASTSQTNPQTSSWSDTTSLTQGGVKPSGKKASGKTAAAAPEKTAQSKGGQSKGGKYKLHIAALRSRAAAEALAQKLMQEHASDLHDRKPAVDEAVIGSMGTFYRVRVGSYKTADEPRGLCNALRNSGYDCLVVSN